jgi:predicted metal-dependent hydrolase
VSRLDGRVSLTLPQWTPEREGIAFLQSKEAWLRMQLGGLEPSVQVQVGRAVMFAGTERSVIAHDRTGVRLTDAGIAVSAARPAGPQVRAFLRNKARDALVAASDRHAAKLGRPYARITLRDTRSRWGSCTTDGALMYSWRLIMAPPEVLDYVAAHEVAHLAEMNHGPAFWRIVERLCPDHGCHRAWLRQNGDRLHRFTFGN